MRYIDRTIATVTVLLLLAIIAYQGYSLVEDSREVKAEITAAQRVKARADVREIAIPPMDRAEYSGQAFKAWEEIPLARAFSAADFQPRER